MKTQSKQNITGSRRLKANGVRPIILSVASALSLMSAQAYASFAATPIYLQNETKTSGGQGETPHVTLFIDDSGSMEDLVTGSKDTRMTVTKRVLNTILKDYNDKFAWNLQTLNKNGGSNTSGYATKWTDMQAQVEKMTSTGGTATTRRYYEIIRDEVIPNTLSRCQRNYIVVMSDGDANSSCLSSNEVWEVDSTGELRFKGYQYVSTNGVAFDYDSTDKLRSGTSTRTSASYFGNPTEAGVCRWANGSGPYNTFWDSNDHFDNSGVGFFSRKLASEDLFTASHGKDKYGVSWDGHEKDPKDSEGNSIWKNQLVETFTIGFAGMTKRGERYLKAGASKDAYNFFADNESELKAAFDSAFSTISTNSATTGAVSGGTVAPTTTSSGISGMAANVQLNTGTWSSRLQFYGIDTKTGVVNTSKVSYPYFGARQTLINADGKNVYWANASYGSNSMFGISGSKTDEWKDALVPWVIRSKADATINSTYSTANGYSQDYRVRTAEPEADETRNLGDILDSPILTIGGGQTSDGLVNGRNEFLVTAANDGMVHLFQSYNDPNHPYSLALSYIPAAMERGSSENDTYGGKNIAQTLKEVAHKDYGDSSHPHRYLVNGGIVVRRTAADANVKGQQSFMFGAMGQGARGAYALNIGGKNRVTGENIGLNADSGSWNTQVPLFETAKTDTTVRPVVDNNLGYTIGTPQIGRIALQRTSGAVDFTQHTRYAGFLANGYGPIRVALNDSLAGSSPETALYVYDMLGQNANDGTVSGAKAGDVIHKFTIGGYAGLSSPTLVDADFDGVVDVAYAGDYAGNLYRFDMRGDDTSKWKVTKIFSGSKSRPITSAPAVSRRSKNRYVVIFGTGSDIYQSDVEDKTQQAVYGLYDDLTEEVESAATEADLQEQTLSETTGGYRQIASTNAIGSDKKGWYVPLGASDGERVVVKPTMILRTAVISTRIYEQKSEKDYDNTEDVCRVYEDKVGTASSSWVLTLNAETGGALAKTDARLLFDSTSSVYYNGMKYDGITSFTFMDATKLNDSPVTRDGDSGGSGTDQVFKAANTDIPNNKCFSREAVRTLLLSSSDANSTLSNLDVTGRICGIRRLSWREIFF